MSSEQQSKSLSPEEFYSITKYVIQREEAELAYMGEGIYWMPELALAYLIGKEVKSKHRECEWIREFSPPGYKGIVDLCIGNLLVEFKIRATRQSYLADIEKLHDFDANKMKAANIEHKIFIALADSFFDEISGRYDHIDDCEHVFKREEDIYTFTTSQKRYAKQIYCSIGMWEVR